MGSFDGTVDTAGNRNACRRVSFSKPHEVLFHDDFYYNMGIERLKLLSTDLWNRLCIFFMHCLKWFGQVGYHVIVKLLLAFDFSYVYIYIYVCVCVFRIGNCMIYVFCCLFNVRFFPIPATYSVRLFKSCLCDCRSKSWRFLQPCSMKPWVALSMWSDSPPMCNIYIYKYIIQLPIRNNGSVRKAIMK